MDSEVAGGGIADRGGHVIVLVVHSDFRTNSVAVAPGSLQLQKEPGILTGREVLPQLRGFAERGHDRVNLAVVVEVGEGGPSVCSRRKKVLAGGPRNVPKG